MPWLEDYGLKKKKKKPQSPNAWVSVCKLLGIQNKKHFCTVCRGDDLYFLVFVYLNMVTKGKRDISALKQTHLLRTNYSTFFKVLWCISCAFVPTCPSMGCVNTHKLRMTPLPCAFVVHLHLCHCLRPNFCRFLCFKFSEADHFDIQPVLFNLKCFSNVWTETLNPELTLHSYFEFEVWESICSV